MSQARRSVISALRRTPARNKQPVRCLATEATERANYVRIVEVGPRDGLQNEKRLVSVDVKVELIRRLAAAGLRDIEVGSFVSARNVPQMAQTPEILQLMGRDPQLHQVNKAILVPNMRGFTSLQNLEQNARQNVQEISIFAAASEAFSRANTNCTIAESLERLGQVANGALEAGYRVRGYVSVVVECPFDGPTDPKQVAAVSKSLAEMGCYEISLGDTIGVATPAAMESMLNAVVARVPVNRLAAHCHDTYNTGLSNVLRMVQCGVRTVDASIAGLGGCPNAPGAQGNIATEDVVYALAKEGYNPSNLADKLDDLAQVGEWVSQALDRQNASRVGIARMALARKNSQSRESAETGRPY